MCFSCYLLSKIGLGPCSCLSKCIKRICSIEYCKRIPIKRWFLPLVGLLALVTYEEFRDFVYLPLVVSIVFFILFWNFPFLVYYPASRPLYYEDLFIDEKKLPNYDVNPEIKKKFQFILVWTLIITNTMLVAALSDYWLYKTDFVLNFMEILGITGGIIKIFQIINNTIGRILLKILRYYVKKESSKFKSEQIDHIEKIVRLKRIASQRAFQSIEMNVYDPQNTIIKMSSIEKIEKK